MNILLIQLKRIGDLVLTTPAIAALREKFPNAKISLIVSPGCAELLPAIPKIDNKLVVNNVASWLEITRTGFHYSIDFTRNDRSSFLTRLSRAKTRIASERRKQKSTFRSRAYNTFVTAPLKQLHTVDYNLKLLEPLGIAGPTPSVQLKIPELARKKATELRNAHKIDKQFIVFHPGSARAEKFWEPDRWAEVINEADEKFDPVLTGGNFTLEQNHLRQIKSKLRRRIVDLSGQTDLLTLAALIAKARLLVTVDSAPVHFAAAAGIAQVALFGPTNPFHWRPRDTRALILQGTSTIPLHEFSPDQPRVPMKQISTKAVIDAMDALLSSPTA
jgi:predicted lipopolysaccharide heptosyltransferase III